MLAGSWVSQAISVAARLGIADGTQDGPKSFQELARSTNTDARSLYRLLRALASVGVFTEVAPGRFGLTPLAACLQTDAPSSMRDMAIILGHEAGWQARGQLLYSVTSGRPSFDHLHGMGFFDYLAQDPDTGRIFDGAMTNLSATANAAIVAGYDFSPFRRLVEIGGGHGTLLALILQANSAVRGVLFDLPPVIEGARGRIEAEGLGERCELVVGDFFEAVPGGGDAYLMKHVIHDWDEERAIAILKNCHRAMGENGKLLLVEHVIQPGNEPSFWKLLDLEMLIAVGGRERTEEEFRALYAAAGFELTRVVPTPCPMSVIEGARIST
jgi:O-methyltransferase domain